jgi:hypothetical protein
MRVDKDFSKNEPFDDIDRLFEHSDSKIPAPGKAFDLTLATLRAQHELDVAIEPEPQPLPLRSRLISLQIAILLAANFSSGVNQDTPPTVESFAATAPSPVATREKAVPVKAAPDSLRGVPQYLDYTELIRQQNAAESVIKRPVVPGNSTISSGFLPQIDRTGDNTAQFDQIATNYEPNRASVDRQAAT